MWRRAKEYHFLDIDDELMKFVNRLAQIGQEKLAAPAHVASLLDPPENKALTPSVMITPSTVCVRPFKLVKTNRTIREPKFGGPFNFCLGE